jgi:hypothetical protein
MLFLTTPGGGFERFVLEMSEPATGPVLPQPTPPDMGKLMALAAKYKIDILGPLPA